MNPLIVHSAPPVSELSVTSSSPDYPLAFIVDWRSFTWWQAATNAAQTIVWTPVLATPLTDFLIGKHNLGSVGAYITVEGSDDDFVADIVTLVATEFVVNDEPFFRRSSEPVKAKYRVVIEGASAPPKIGILSMGEGLLFERPIIGGYTPIEESSKSEVAISKGGVPLGAVQSHVAIKATAEVRDISDAWFRSEFVPLWDSHLGRLVPFYWLHNYTFAPDDIYMMRMDVARLAAPYTDGGRRKVSLRMVGVK